MWWPTLVFNLQGSEKKSSYCQGLALQDNAAAWEVYPEQLVEYHDHLDFLVIDPQPIPTLEVADGECDEHLSVIPSTVVSEDFEVVDGEEDGEVNGEEHEEPESEPWQLV